jgi:hypothetical protein
MDIIYKTDRKPKIPQLIELYMNSIQNIQLVGCALLELNLKQGSRRIMIMSGQACGIFQLKHS